MRYRNSKTFLTSRLRLQSSSYFRESTILKFLSLHFVVNRCLLFILYRGKFLITRGFIISKKIFKIRLTFFCPIFTDRSTAHVEMCTTRISANIRGFHHLLYDFYLFYFLTVFFQKYFFHFQNFVNYHNLTFQKG